MYTGTVPRFPTLIVAMSIGSIAVLNFFTGVILSAIRKIYRINFERGMTALRYLGILYSKVK